MSRSRALTLVVGVATSISGLSGVTIAGDCGCDNAPVCRTTVQHVHRFVLFGHCCRHDCYPPVGTVVQSAPVAMPMAMPMQAFAPVAAAPMAMVAQAPTFSLALQSAPQQPAAAPSSCGSDSSMAQFQNAMVKAMVERALTNNGASSALASAAPASAPAASPSASLEDKLARLENSVTRLSNLTEKISGALIEQQKHIEALEASK